MNFDVKDFTDKMSENLKLIREQSYKKGYEDAEHNLKNVASREYQRGYDAAKSENKFPRKMLVWDDNERKAHAETVYAILDTITTYPVIGGVTRWRYAKELPAEQAKRMRPMTHAEVFKAIREGAVIRIIGRERVTNILCSHDNLSCREICYNYTGTDSDVWQKMEA